MEIENGFSTLWNNIGISFLRRCINLKYSLKLMEYHKSEINFFSLIHQGNNFSLFKLNKENLFHSLFCFCVIILHFVLHQLCSSQHSQMNSSKTIRNFGDVMKTVCIQTQNRLERFAIRIETERHTLIAVYSFTFHC